MRSKVVTDSSRISQLDYDEDTQKLVVIFKRGGAYEYYDVPEEVYEDLVNSKSIGRGFELLIKGPGYQYQKL